MALSVSGLRAIGIVCIFLALACAGALIFMVLNKPRTQNIKGIVPADLPAPQCNSVITCPFSVTDLCQDFFGEPPGCMGDADTTQWFSESCCTLSCDAVIEIWTQIGPNNDGHVYPNTDPVMGLFKHPNDIVWPLATEGDRLAVNAACALVTNFRTQELSVHPNQDGTGEGRKAMYRSIASCIASRYHC